MLDHPAINSKSSNIAEAHESIDFKIDENYIYQIDNMSHYEKKENKEWRKHVCERKTENTYDIKIYNAMTS